MGARDLLHDLRDAGLLVALIDDRIIVTPRDRLTDPMRDAIRAHRTELVEALKPATRRPTARIYRLTRAQGDEAHAEDWSADTISAFSVRRDAFLRRGYGTDDADDLAERLTLRDREQDDRRMCVECTQFGERGQCLAAAAGRLPGADRRLEPVPTILQRCDAFGLRKGFT
jgi:hypothetical protein